MYVKFTGKKSTEVARIYSEVQWIQEPEKVLPEVHRWSVQALAKPRLTLSPCLSRSVQCWLHVQNVHNTKQKIFRMSVITMSDDIALATGSPELHEWWCPFIEAISSFVFCIDISCKSLFHTDMLTISLDILCHAKFKVVHMRPLSLAWWRPLHPSVVPALQQRSLSRPKFGF